MYIHTSFSIIESFSANNTCTRSVSATNFSYYLLWVIIIATYIAPLAGMQ